jgi:Cu/Zn superoxide dismutase
MQMIRTRITTLSLAFATAAFGVACDADRQEADETPPATEEMELPPASPAEELLASGDFDEAEGVTGDIGGRFKLRSDAAGGATLMVELEGLTPGEHAWHIHQAECGTDGPVVIAFTPAPDIETVAGAQALVAGADGRATATVTIPKEQLDKLHSGMATEPTSTTVTPPNSENAPVDRPARATGDTGERKFSIHVHERAGTDHGPTVACTNLDASKIHENAPRAAPTY